MKTKVKLADNTTVWFKKRDGVGEADDSAPPCNRVHTSHLVASVVP